MILLAFRINWNLVKFATYSVFSAIRRISMKHHGVTGEHLINLQSITDKFYKRFIRRFCILHFIFPVYLVIEYPLIYFYLEIIINYTRILA